MSAALKTPRREPGEKKGAYTRRLVALGLSDAEIVALCPKAKPAKHREAVDHGAVGVVRHLQAVPPHTPRRTKISTEALGRSRIAVPVSPLGVTTTAGPSEAFRAARPPRGVVPDGVTPMAMDADLGVFAGGLSNYTENLSWMGMPFLAELAQRAEYRQIVETLAKEMTRRWIKVSATGDEDKTKKVSAIEDALKGHKIRQKFRRLAELDGFFGRGHLAVNNGVNEDRELLKVPMILDRRTFEPGSLRGFRVVEPVWTYPGVYDSMNPLDDDFYAPRTWYVMGKEVHRTRLMTLVSREVPDLLKPQYQFGGISLSQLARPYVDNWLRTRQSVSDLVHSFSTMILSTDLSAVMGGEGGGGQDLFDRIELFNNLRDNRGMMALDKDREELSNVVTPLGTLDHLQAQAQEQQAAVSHIPLIILLGITPSGLNASSDGELQAWAAYVKSMQEHLFDDPLSRVIDIIQIDLFGEIDPDVTFDYEPLRELSDAEETAARKSEADTHAVYVNAGVIGPDEVRQTLAEDEDSPYAGVDLSGPPPTPPTPPGGEEDPLQPPDAPGGAPPASATRASLPPPRGGDGMQDRITDIAAAIRARQAHDADFNEADHPRGQPKNSGEFAKSTGANKTGKVRWEAEQGFRDAASGREPNVPQAWSDKQRELYHAGYELHSRKELTNHDPSKPNQPLRLTNTAAKNPDYTPEQAKRVFSKTLVDSDPVFYHEGPGDWAAAAKTDGIENDYGVFATIGKPSNFADADVKTVVAFKVPRNVLMRSVVPDMRYSGEGDPYQAVMKEHPDLTGADVGIGVEGNIPPAWIKDIKVVRKQAYDADMKPVERRTYGTLQIGIETRRGELRKGRDWQVEMPADYGYIMRTTGADGDRVDIFIGPYEPTSLPAFVVEQRRLDGRPDEHKVLIGFQTMDQAIATYDRSFSDGSGPDRRGDVHQLTFDDLRAWLRDNSMK